MRDQLLDLLAAEWGGEGRHGAYRSQMPDPRIRLHELASCASTQDELRALAAAGAPAFTAVRADVQHAGRGRRGRRWEAPAGTALLVSILLRPRRPSHEVPVLSLAGGIAAVECARAFGADARPELAERRRLRGAQARRRARRARARRQRPAGRRHEPLLAGRGPPRSPIASCRPRSCSRRDPRPARPAALTALLDALLPAGRALRRARARRRSRRAPGRSTRSRAPRCSCGSPSGEVVRGHGRGHRRRRLPARAHAPRASGRTRAARSCASPERLTRYARGRDPPRRVRHRHRRRRRQDLRLRAPGGARARRGPDARHADRRAGRRRRRHALADPARPGRRGCDRARLSRRDCASRTASATRSIPSTCARSTSRCASAATASSSRARPACSRHSATAARPPISRARSACRS